MSCDSFRGPSVAGSVVSVMLAVGIAVSYVPQHVRIIQRKTSEGISPLFLLLGTTSGISAFANLVLLSKISIGCCYAGLSKFECFNGQLGMIQVGTQAVFATLILVFCVYCTQGSPYQDKQQYKQIYHIYLFTVGYTAVLIGLIIYTLKYNGQWLFPLANTFGVLSTVLASFQYLPQLYTIYMLKHPGSLSIAMMCMQTPGGFLWSLSLFFSPGAIWSSWLPYLTAASLQGLLLVMCVYYTHTYPTKLLEQREEQNIAARNSTLDETDPLLGA